MKFVGLTGALANDAQLAREILADDMRQLGAKVRAIVDGSDPGGALGARRFIELVTSVRAATGRVGDLRSGRNLAHPNHDCKPVNITMRYDKIASTCPLSSPPCPLGNDV
jgi:hypothetical protein